ncbi:MAG: FAD-dependent oxidoreductase, partial [Pseudomonadota bacterium]
MAAIEVKVPDIGDFEDVPVIEIHVEAGSVVQPEDPLITLESDKATLDVPSPCAGKVVEMKVALGDRLSQGSLILMLEAEGAASEAAPAAAPPQEETAPAPVAASHGGGSDLECEVMVLGAGPGGYSAAFRSADLGMKTVLVERWSTLGGVCLNVGCIPSKALLHTAAVMDEVKAMAAHGISYAAPTIDLDVLRGHKDKVVGKLTGGLAGMAKARKVDVVTGTGQFLDPNHIEVALSDGSGSKTIKFQKAIIAAGSEAVKLPFIPEDPRIVDSTGALELREIPKRMLVIGGGIIGLEMANVYSSLGARIDVV